MLKLSLCAAAGLLSTLTYSSLPLAIPPAAASADPMGVDLERAFLNFEFDRPVYLTGANDGSERVFVVEQAGTIWTFDGTTDRPEEKKVFLDISERVSREGNEEGLLGLAFHPKFQENGRFYVHYSSSVHDHHGVLAMFTANGNKADGDSERILLEVHQPYRNHNGGMIAFGPDGYLYMALGDGGAANDPHGHGQDLSTLLGTILRLDVDETTGDLPYGIPGDNPFVDVEGARPEIYAFGLRNAWRFAFDSVTGELWAGDVGQNKMEEVSIIVKGGNYGWKTFEATRDFSNEPLSRGEHIPPVATYGRQDGISITGGEVYRGARYPSFDGGYFYADYVSGNMWMITRNEDGEFKNELVRRTRRSIASFGTDDAGEVFALSFDGKIYRIVPSDLPEGTFDDWPAKISNAGIYESAKEKTLRADVIPYEVNAPFWADGADKRRYVQLPEGASMTYREDGVWELPVGSVVVKEFLSPGGRREGHLETRLNKLTDTGWEAATYVWSATGRDARLAVSGKILKVRDKVLGNEKGRLEWHAPSAAACTSCHIEAQGFSLGLSTLQLNREVDGENQILSFAARGLVEIPGEFDPSKAPAHVSPTDESAPIGERARAWLHVNCAMCHQPNGPGNAAIDLRVGTDLAETGLVGAAPSQGDLGVENALIVAPGEPDRSTLVHRVETLGDGRMPNIGSHRVDAEGAALLRAWIESL